MSELKCLVTTSVIAPFTAIGTAMSWMAEGAKPPDFTVLAMCSLAASAQLSNLSSFMSVRTGIEPLARLKFSWKRGSIRSLAKSFCPARRSASLLLNIAKLSTMKRKALSVPGGLAQT